eukprot:CAMPEP_0178899346 /NCGR_PEP_ID=MMETSP0786-20121207/2845_1 /TAXON_ID=186022 /ORGANISM="Thalassionema frauenfeldii, Strain CCMP 1798" /LENGTH=221 /DNA_ID=CAMNT_0020570185 /DNA_START=65 /DNA_END=727 /DNA_ORIENTATION=-
MNGDSVEEKPTLRSPAHLFDLFGWKPDPAKTDDENYMDIVFLITRSWRHGQQGHMGALIVRPAPDDSSVFDDDDDHENRIYQGILGAATNIPLFGTKECTSDIHAEIVALGQACRSKQSTENCTAYITIPPCKRCFAALVTFGIKRIITRKQSPKLIRDTAARHGILVENFSWEMNRRHMERINQLVNTDKTDKELMKIAEQNRIRRQTRKLEKQKKISEW